MILKKSYLNEQILYPMQVLFILNDYRKIRIQYEYK